MLVEILECECGHRQLRIGGTKLKKHNCGGSLKLMAETEVAVVKLKALLDEALAPVSDSDEPNILERS